MSDGGRFIIFMKFCAVGVYVGPKSYGQKVKRIPYAQLNTIAK